VKGKMVVRLWRGGRKGRVWWAALRVRTMEREPDPALMIVAESAPASAAACALGGVRPVDQSIEDTLVDSSLTLKSVKVSTPGDAVSTLPLPVMWASSVIAGAPAPAVSTGLGVTGGTGGGCYNGASMVPWF